MYFSWKMFTVVTVETSASLEMAHKQGIPYLLNPSQVAIESFTDLAEEVHHSIC